MRENYDYLLDHPYEFPGHFLRFSRASYMPKSDLRFVIVLSSWLKRTHRYLSTPSMWLAGLAD